MEEFSDELRDTARLTVQLRRDPRFASLRAQLEAAGLPLGCLFLLTLDGLGPGGDCVGLLLHCDGSARRFEWRGGRLALKVLSAEAAGKDELIVETWAGLAGLQRFVQEEFA